MSAAHIRFERQWEILLYVASMTRGVLIGELQKLLAGGHLDAKAGTIRADLKVLEAAGKVRVETDMRPYDLSKAERPQKRYHFQGPRQPLMRIGQFYCRTCCEFKPSPEMRKVLHGIYPMCRECHRVASRQYYRQSTSAVDRG